LQRAGQEVMTCPCWRGFVYAAGTGSTFWYRAAHIKHCSLYSKTILVTPHIPYLLQRRYIPLYFVTIVQLI